MDPFLGQIILFAGNFAPRGWAFCEGQLLPISENTALFSILGTTYGGDGRTTFALPDLRSRAAVHQGTGPGLRTYPLGSRAGVESVTLTANQLPSHTHPATMVAAPGDGSTGIADGNSLAHATQRGADTPNIYNSGAPSIAMHADSVTVGNTGGGQAINTVQPVLALNYIVALQGVYPSRS